MSNTRVPTKEELELSEEYALKKLCEGQDSITSKFGDNLTVWDSVNKKCKITKKGCEVKRGNPISSWPYDDKGDPVDHLNSEQNTRIRDFWRNNKWTPDFYVWKNIKGSKGPVCARGNKLLLRWCNYPKTRTTGDLSGKGYDDVPPFKYTVRDDGTEDCIITKEYCDNRGVDYDSTPGDEHCVVTIGQKIGEFLLSDVFIRHVKRATS
jgi:hypothetical protein